MRSHELAQDTPEPFDLRAPLYVYPIPDKRLLLYRLTRNSIN
jgi:hypothetical protein